jgi:hypothetical protein
MQSLSDSDQQTVSLRFLKRLGQFKLVSKRNAACRLLWSSSLARRAGAVKPLHLIRKVRNGAFLPVAVVSNERLLRVDLTRSTHDRRTAAIGAIRPIRNRAGMAQSGGERTFAPDFRAGLSATIRKARAARHRRRCPGNGEDWSGVLCVTACRLIPAASGPSR